jgi:hypothetical protein
MTILNPIAKLNELPDWFRNTESGREIECEILAQNHEQRAEWLVEKSALQADLEKVTQTLSADETKKKRKRDAVIESLKKAQGDFEESQRLRRGTANRLNNKISAIDKDLQMTADNSIDIAIDDWRAEESRVRHLTPTKLNRPTNQFLKKSGNQIVEHFTNRDKLSAAYQAIQVCIRDLQAMKLENPDDVPSAVEKITSELPQIGSITSNFGM